MTSRVETAGGPEVDEREPTVAKHHHVPGMRVGVVLRVDEHLLHHATEQLFGELAPVDAELVDRGGLTHADAVEPLHDEHTPRRQVVEHGGDPHVAAVVEIGGDVGGVARFDLEVELLPQAFRELVGEIRHLVLGAPRGALLDHGGELVEDVQVAVHRVGDARPLHLDDHLPPVVEARPVGLPDRCRRQRLPVEVGEDLVGGSAQLLLDQLAQAVGRRGRHVVLQVRQLLGHDRGHEVRARRGHLTHLHEHPAALLERVAEPARERNLPRLPVLAVAAEPERGAEPVADGDAGDLRVPAHAPAAPLHRLDGMRDRRQPVLGAGERARFREELEPHRRGHHTERGEQPDVAREPGVRRLALTRDRERQRDPADPTDHTGQQRRGPRAANTEQPADQPRQDEHTRQ
jgi:hypothetical protein